jgi:hypothetical protein
VFIVGAPRSGTTTMARMLQAHPQIAFPFVKEPHFFSQHDLRGLDDAELRRVVERDYLDHFFIGLKPGQNVGADGSVSYLYAAEQLQPALKLWPNSRFIVGVRDPLDLLRSLHKRLLYTGDENLRRFEDAWDAIPDRAAGKRIPWSAIDPRWLRYEEAARYATYIERLFAAVGRDRCLVVVFDDLTADPAGQFRRMLEFSGLPDMPLPEVENERDSKSVRHIWLQQILKRPPRVLLPYLAGAEYRRRFRQATKAPTELRKPSRSSLRKRILRWNRAPDDKRPIALATQHAVKAQFQDEIDRLGALIGRDLGRWLQPEE